MSAHKVVERALRSYTEGEDAANIVLTVLAEEGYRIIPPGELEPIETAPKDGTPIIGFEDEDSAFICRWGVDECGNGDWLQYGTDVVSPRYWIAVPRSLAKGGGDGRAALKENAE